MSAHDHPGPLTDARLTEIEKVWLAPCGSCDAGLPMQCACPAADPRAAVSELVAEVRRLRQDRNRTKPVLDAVNEWRYAEEPDDIDNAAVGLIDTFDTWTSQ
jgi:hypothetical protein